MRQADLEATLRTILGELAPYLSDLVLVGGWVPYLYRHYGGFSSWRSADTLTFELDLVIRRPLPPDGRPNLASVLRNAGFEPQGSEAPPAIWTRDVEAGERIEFLTEHRGTARGQGHMVPVTEQPGLGAIPLVELEIMQTHARSLILSPIQGFGAVEVRVPALGAYVVNKALTFIRRRPRADEAGTPKLAKDLFYLRDLAAAGDDVLDAIRADIEIIARSRAAHARRLRTAATNLHFVVAGHLSHHLNATARMVVERNPAADISREEARTRGFLLDLRALLLESANIGE